MRTVVLPEASADSDPAMATGWWHESAEAGRIVCDLCPRACSMKPGDRGFCFVRQNIDGQMALTTYGRSTGFCIDPVEKKPLNHFFPGTPVLSFGTAGCNLGCQFCQNWDISKSREIERLSQLASPQSIAQAALQTGCRSVAFTYNDPIIWAEYAIDTAQECRRLGIQSVAVTAGYITPAARPAFFHAVDAANIDLKAFTEEFYHRITYSHLQPVLETLHWLKHESEVWFEITNLVIPDANDSPDEVRRMCDWILQAVGPDVPVHFSAFHPDFRMTDRSRTPHATLLQCRQVAIEQGLRFAYAGNVNDARNQSTWCPKCGELLIERNQYTLGQFRLTVMDNGSARCSACGEPVPGRFDTQPGTWGCRRQPVRISDFTPPEPREPLVKLPSTPANQDPAVSPNQNPSQPQKISMASSSHIPGTDPLTTEQEVAIHRAASDIVAAAIHQRPVDVEALRKLDSQGTAQRTVMGTFVTLKRNGRLRACCGMVGQPIPLLRAVHQAATKTATEDHRLPPVSPVELRYLTLDVTLLSDFETIPEQWEARLAAVEVGRHGLKITRGGKAGLLLPSVAVEAGWDRETFLNQVCRKAGLPITAWQDPNAILQRFEGHMIEGAFDTTVLRAGEGRAKPSMPQAQVNLLTPFVSSNVLALSVGAIPACFGNEFPDGSVHGISIRLRADSLPDAATFSALQWRPEMPLQTTLLQLTQRAADWLSGLRAKPEKLHVDCMILSDPAMHGTIDQPAWQGIDPGSRAVMVVQGARRGIVFDPSASPQQLVTAAASAAEVRSPAAAVYSFSAQASISPFTESSVPRAQAGSAVRPPAVAGKFYPAATDELLSMVESCFAGHKPPDPVAVAETAWSAAMLPHAGLRFSGRIAAGVLNQLQITDTVIVIGPKHTHHGVDWAIAPHEAWEIPGAVIKSDRQLAELLASQIDGLQLDSAAHAEEHSIEVLLPLLARMAPAVRVVGIVMGGGTLEQCQVFGRQLAEVLRGLPSRPLLLISSDMNHFATDAENRRLDEMALVAMETADPAHLHHIVTSNAISMCGVLPAVTVLEALRELNGLQTIQRCGYATSGDSGATPDRVVGYAGLLLKQAHS